MIWFLSFFTLTGFNFTFWLIISCIRFLFEKKQGKKPYEQETQYSVLDVAAVIPAHNEEKTIRRTITALLKILPKKNIYVASDFSTDKTLTIIHDLGIRSLDIRPNRGKAKSLVWIMKEYGLFNAYKFICINDADTEIDEHCFERALPLFNDPEIAAVATHGLPRLKNYSFWQNFFISYRIRLWRIIQVGMRFGQTWKYTNTSFIIPGSLSIYRTSVIEKLEVDAPGLLIEDFNMTFEVHKKKLGKIAYDPSIIGVHQDPNNLLDYVRQVRRWNVGFFQTVKRHGIWPSFFWLSTTLYYMEIFFFALFIWFVPTLLVYFMVSGYQPIYIPFPYFYHAITVIDLIIGVFVIDYLMTVIAAVIEKKPMLLFYGFGFFFLRYIDALIYLTSPFVAFTSRYAGTWKSPKRL